MAIAPLDAGDAAFLDDEHYHLYLGAISSQMDNPGSSIEVTVANSVFAGDAAFLDDKHYHLYLGALIHLLSTGCGFDQSGTNHTVIFAGEAAFMDNEHYHHHLGVSTQCGARYCMKFR